MKNEATTKNTQSASSPDLWSKKQVARKLGCCERTVNNLMKSKSISYVKIGSAVRFGPEAVDQFLKSYTIKAAA